MVNLYFFIVMHFHRFKLASAKAWLFDLFIFLYKWIVASIVCFIDGVFGGKFWCLVVMSSMKHQCPPFCWHHFSGERGVRCFFHLSFSMVTKWKRDEMEVVLSWKMTCWIVSFSLWPDTTSPLEKSVCECFVCVFVITQIISHAGLVKVEWNLTPIAFLLIISSVLSKHVALWMCGLIPCQCENALIHWGILKPWSASFHSLRSRCGNKREGKWSPVL